MNGLELSRLYYEEVGRPMLEREFSRYLDRIAVGLAGHGSECFGYDDEISTDHDYEAGFCLWITQEDDRTFGFPLFRAYRKLPGEFHGVKIRHKSLFGSECKGVHTIKDFYAFYTGTGEAPKTNAQWLSIPSYYLAEATNGAVFTDPLGEFTRIREEIRTGMPEDVRKKKLASHLFYMAQMGQYNYGRCLSHGENLAAATALSGFAAHTAAAVFLLNRTHTPYYKWRFRAMRSLPILGNLEKDLEGLMEHPYDGNRNIPVIESAAACVAAELQRQGLSDCHDDYLEPHAYRVQAGITDTSLRTGPVMLPEGNL